MAIDLGAVAPWQYMEGEEFGKGFLFCYFYGNSFAEYACPVWNRTSHVGKVDTCLNDSMRTISGALSTPRAWLPVMSGIAPPHIRRAAAEQKKYRQILELTPQNCTRRIVESAPHTSRLS